MNRDELYDSSSAAYVLGVMIKEPNLLLESKYSMTDSDFRDIHKIIFNSIVELATQGIQDIKASDIDMNLKQYPTRYKLYRDANGFDLVSNIISLTKGETDRQKFDSHYETIKKLTILRDFEQAGVDTKHIYNPTLEPSKIEKEQKKFNEIKIEDIFENIRNRINKIEDKNIGKDLIKARPVGHGLDELMKELRSGEGAIGYPLDGVIFNFATMGARLGRLYLYSAPSGHGKTRMMVGNACSLSLPYIKDGEIIIKKDLKKVVFIATEMDPDEIQTLVLAYVSGVDEEKILQNNLTQEEENLVKNAIEIMKEYSDNLVIEKISDPNISTLRSKVLRYVIKDSVAHIFYDYIFMSPALSTEFKMSQRDDISLMMMANTLKEIASDYGVFVFTGTQVNREWEKRQFRNENVIAGSKAIADKIDFGAVAVKASEEEIDKIREMLRADGIMRDPNVIIDFYKNRRSRITNMKLFRFFDYGTCRVEDLLLTDTNYHKIHEIGEIKYTYTKRGLLELAVDRSVN